MAKGLRIHHPTERNCIVLMLRAADPTKGVKDSQIPIHLDENGDSIVCEEIWQSLVEADRLKRVKNEFIVLNEVPDPPTIGIGFGGSKPPRFVPAKEATPEGVSDAQLQMVAQRFAPRGVNARITTKGKAGL